MVAGRRLCRVSACGPGPERGKARLSSLSLFCPASLASGIKRRSWWVTLCMGPTVGLPEVMVDLFGSLPGIAAPRSLWAGGQRNS